MSKRAKLTISGQVQAVSFRLHSQKWAHNMGLQGHVHNNPDGTITITIQGPEEKVEDFISRCYDGPKWARVTDVKIQWLDQVDPHLTSFEITDS